jgi:hypothetical protein
MSDAACSHTCACVARRLPALRCCKLRSPAAPSAMLLVELIHPGRGTGSGLLLLRKLAGPTGGLRPAGDETNHLTSNCRAGTARVLNAAWQRFGQ